MVAASSSSSSSICSSSASSSLSSSICSSSGSSDDHTPKSTVKFLCSYGGRIHPRHTDGKLRYLGGETRVLAVDRSITFSELEAKLRDLCSWESPILRCQLPLKDLDDVLVSITSDEDLANLYEEYASSSPLKIRAFLFHRQPKPSSPSSDPSRTALMKANITVRPPLSSAPHLCCIHHNSATMSFSGWIAGDRAFHGRHGNRHR